MIAIPSNEITQDDVNRVLDMAQNGITLTPIRQFSKSFQNLSQSISSIMSNHQLV
jgi:hypothetical protein